MYNIVDVGGTAEKGELAKGRGKWREREIERVSE